jgi:hypothetical protein
MPLSADGRRNVGVNPQKCAAEDRSGEGILRFDFAEPDDKLEKISWEEFFQTFDDRELALLHQDKTSDGRVSRFFKFVRR